MRLNLKLGKNMKHFLAFTLTLGLILPAGATEPTTQPRCSVCGCVCLPDCPCKQCVANAKAKGKTGATRKIVRVKQAREGRPTRMRNQPAQPAQSSPQRQYTYPTVVTGGILGGLSFPLGELRTKEDLGTNRFAGFNLGGHLDINFTTHQQVRGTLIYTKFLPGEWEHTYTTCFPHYVDVTVRNGFTITQLGADWVYNFTNYQHGWYTVLGLNAAHLQASRKITRKVDGFKGFSHTDTSSNDAIGLKGGVGFNFDPHLSLEGTLNHVSTNSDLLPFRDIEANWLQTSLVIRF